MPWLGESEKTAQGAVMGGGGVVGVPDGVEQVAEGGTVRGNCWLRTGGPSPLSL